MKPAQFEILDWDTATFGFTTARITPPRLEAPALEAALAELARLDAKLVYWAADPYFAEGREAASACHGFLADRKVTYVIDGFDDPALPRPVLSASAGAAPPKPSPPWTISPIRSGVSDDALHSLHSLAIRAGIHSRFNTDPLFPTTLFRALYGEWMRKSLSGEIADAVLVAVDRPDAAMGGDVPAGMITVSAREGAGSIGLVAVDAVHEGRGLGTDLLRAAGAWFAARGCAGATVVTQGGNAAACALYEKNGYRVGRREDVWHFWL